MNWITEKYSKLKFIHNGTEIVAKWYILQHFSEMEKADINKLSKLT